MEVPPEACCPREHAAAAIAAIRRRFAERSAHMRPEDGFPLLCRALLEGGRDLGAGG
jgi:hypothetical protein